MDNRKILTLLFLIVLLACREKRLDSFELNSFEGEKLVIKMFMEGNKAAVVTLHKTIPPFAATNTADTIKNATVTIFENETPVDILYKTDAYSYGSNSGFRFQSNKTYAIEVIAEEKTASSKFEFIPNAVIIVKDTSVYSADSNQIEIHCRFVDNPTSEDYYLIKSEGKYNGRWIGSGGTNLYQIFSKHCISYTYSADNVELFNDLCFNGSSIDFFYNFSTRNVESYQNGSPIYSYTDSVRLVLLHITPSYYNYIKGISQQIVTNDDPFSNPVSVYSNIIGGYGIVAGFASDTLEIDLW